MRVLVLLACLGALACAEKARFDNYVVYRVVPTTQEQLDVLTQLQQYPDGVSFWTDMVTLNKDVDIMVIPHKLPEFKELLVNFNFKNKVFIKDVQEAIDNENSLSEPRAMEWTSYHRLGDIHDWLAELAANFSEVSVIVAGTSYEGRELRGVKITYDDANPVVFIEGGIHAREWISPATVTFMINELLSSTDPEVRRVAESFTWHIVPSVNPDGYEFTHTNNRLWRKTRRPNEGGCIGADPNRNFPTEFWGEAPGASSDPCSETYSGSAPFSEDEMRTLGDYVTSISAGLAAYINFHSYGQVILLPWGHTVDPIPNFDELMVIGTKAATALATRYGTRYDVGNVLEQLYACNGLSMDWAYGALNIPVTYSFELRDNGLFAFLLPAAQIIPSGLETLDALISIMGDVLDTLPRK